jgi:hypothetical protein
MYLLIPVLLSGSVSGINGVPVYPDPDSQSGFRRAKMAHRSRNKFINLMFLYAGYSLLTAEGFFFSLDFWRPGDKYIAIFNQKRKEKKIS